MTVVDRILGDRRAAAVPIRGERADGQPAEITVDHGSLPHVVAAHAGFLLRLVLRRRDDDPCSKRVLFSSPRLGRRLAPLSDTTIMPTPHRPGEIRFTSAWAEIEARSGSSRRPRRWDRARDTSEMTRRTDAIGAGVVLWLFTLPHVVLLAVFAIDDDAIVPVALLALVTWIVACVWATD